jgi:hypothetical protein
LRDVFASLGALLLRLRVTLVSLGLRVRSLVVPMVTSPLFAMLEEPLVTVSLLCGHVGRGRKGSFCGEFPTNWAKIVFLVITLVLGYL